VYEALEQTRVVELVNAEVERGPKYLVTQGECRCRLDGLRTNPVSVRTLNTETGIRQKSSLRDVFTPITSRVDVFRWHLWAAPLKAYGAVLRTPLSRVHYQTICRPKNVLTAALPPFVEVAVDDE